MSVTLITCTGGRPEAFKLCYHYMKRQTFKSPIEWIVVNDHYSAADIPGLQQQIKDFILVAGPRTWKEGFNTHRFNMEAALARATGDKILFIEDDDLYKPTYIEHMVKLLDFAEIVGEGNAKYYNVQVPGWKEMNNLRHASLAQTGIRKSMIPLMRQAVDSGELYFDIKFWSDAHLKKVPSIIFSDQNLCIGMKGLPGREGIGAGHRTKDFFIDPGLVKLREWTGDDSNNYLPYIRGNHDRGQPRDTKPVLQRGKMQPTAPSKPKPSVPGRSGQESNGDALSIKGGTPVFLDATKAGRGAVVGQPSSRSSGNIQGPSQPQKR